MEFIFIFALSAIVSFASVWLYRKINLKRKFIIGVDINKVGRPQIAESAGLALLVPIWLGIFLLMFLPGFNAKVVMWGLLLSAFAVVGFADDTKTKFVNKAMPWTVRALPVALISLMFAYVYPPSPEWIIPVALFIAGLAALQNTFAGLNGWEVGSGFIISLAAAYMLYGTPYFMACVILAGAILGMLALNIHPARVFPGDSGTMLIGSAIAGLFALTQDLTLMSLCALLFVPNAIDFILLKLPTSRGDLSQMRIAPYSVLKNGRLGIPKYEGGKVRYDFAKLIMRIFGESSERKIVAIIWLAVAVNATIVILIFNWVW